MLAVAVPPPGPSSSRTPLWLGGAAVVLGVGAVGFELSGRSIFSDAKAATSADEAASLTRSANLRRDLAMGLGAASAITAGAAIYVYTRHGREPHLTPAVTPSAASLVFSGRF